MIVGVLIATGEKLERSRLCGNITDAQADYVKEVVAELKKNGIRADCDLRNEKITYKIREHSLQKLPYLLVAGEREMQSKQVAVRTRKGEDLGSMPIQALIERLKGEVEAKGSAA